MESAEIARRFLAYFEQHGHAIVPSASLVADDPTVLFVIAGMQPFKPYLLGQRTPPYRRVADVQKVVRTLDIDEVGKTTRHATFFQMLGNFSFGDYFKEDAIRFAWELLTRDLGIPAARLKVTVFGGDAAMKLPADDEARALWKKVAGLSDDRILGLGAKDNFWQMGDTGPCGPCSEIHFDMGAIASDQGHTDCKFGCDCGRYVEIWNLVFMQFNRVCDLCDVKGNCLETHLEPLPKPSVDTGAG